MRKACNPDRPLHLDGASVLAFRVSNKQLKSLSFMFFWKSLIILYSLGDHLPSETSKRAPLYSSQWQQCSGVSRSCSNHGSRFCVQLSHDEHSVVTVLECSPEQYSTHFSIDLTIWMFFFNPYEYYIPCISITHSPVVYISHWKPHINITYHINNL